MLNVDPQAPQVAVHLRTMRLSETYKLVSGYSSLVLGLFSFSYSISLEGESIKLLSSAFRGLSSYFRGSISAKNLCQPTCWHVFIRRPVVWARAHGKIRHVRVESERDGVDDRVGGRVGGTEKMEAGGKVDGRGGRRKRGWAPGWKSSYWYAVSDFASSVGRTR